MKSPSVNIVSPLIDCGFDGVGNHIPHLIAFQVSIWGVSGINLGVSSHRSICF